MAQQTPPPDAAFPETSDTEDHADYKEKWQRALADLENARKRFEQEKQALGKFAVAALLEDLLPVLDNFDRATEHVPAEEKDSPWVAGIQYIRKNLHDAVEGHGVSEIPALPGEAFDPATQEAIGTVASADKPEDTVAEIKAKGYRLHDRVLRPALVTVYRKPAAEEGN